jgi:pimeloyl-ACP methyl ester carboxylesterase
MGSDWGTSVSTSLALQHPARLLGIHLVPPLAPPDRAAADLTGEERAALADLDQRSRTGSGYSAVQGTRPQTIGVLADRFAGRVVCLDRGEAVGLDRPSR